jgi:hypothetical protein
MIVIKTNLKKIPKTCKECNLLGNECNLPCSIFKFFITSRHKDCPLIEIPVMEQQNI